MKVHRILGAGFLESVYQRALSLELSEQQISFREQSPIKVHYRGVQVGTFVADYLVEDLVIVEIKAVTSLTSNFEAQLLSYLKATDMRIGLLLNFGSPSLEIARRVNRLPDDRSTRSSAKSA